MMFALSKESSFLPKANAFYKYLRKKPDFI